MALFTETILFDTNGAVITFTYDDIAMKLRSISASNNSNRTLRINLSSPLILSRILNPSDTISVSIPTATRPAFTFLHISKIGMEYDIIQGIEWFITLGL